MARTTQTPARCTGAPAPRLKLGDAVFTPKILRSSKQKTYKLTGGGDHVREFGRNHVSFSSPHHRTTISKAQYSSSARGVETVVPCLCVTSVPGLFALHVSRYPIGMTSIRNSSALVVISTRERAESVKRQSLGTQ